MDHCASHPLRLFFCPGPRDVAIRPRRDRSILRLPNISLWNTVARMQGNARSATAQPPRVPNQARLPFRPWQQRLEVEANRAVQAVRRRSTKPLDPNQCIGRKRRNNSTPNRCLRSEAVTGFEPRAFSCGGVIIPA